MANTTVPEWMTTDYIQDILRQMLKSEELILENSEVTPASAEGLNYLSVIMRIKVKYQHNKNTTTLSIIAKIKIKTNLSQNFGGDLFQREVFFLQSILPAMVERVGENFAPILYHYDDVQGVLFLEDLSVKDFKQIAVHTFLNKEECILGIEALAKMHGASYYVLEKQPELKTKYPGALPVDLLEKLYANAEKALQKLAPTYGLSEKLENKLVTFKEKYDRLEGQISKPLEGGLNILSHCDASKNNMLFTYKDGVAHEVKLLDYQTISYNSFAHDLHNFLFSSVQADVLVNHTDLMLEKYYQKLCQVAPDIPNLTLDRIKSEFSERCYFGLLNIMGFRGYLLADKAVDFDKLLNGEFDQVGFGHPLFIEDIKKFMPFLDNAGFL